MKEDLDDFNEEINQHMQLEHDDQMKDLSNPASQDYVFEKLRDMEQTRLNEGSDRYVPKQVAMPDCDGSDEDSGMDIEHPLDFEQQQAEDSSPFHPDYDPAIDMEQKHEEAPLDFEEDEDMDEDDMLMRNAQIYKEG